jgi:hypothetical protein
MTRVPFCGATADWFAGSMAKVELVLEQQVSEAWLVRQGIEEVAPGK